MSLIVPASRQHTVSQIVLRQFTVGSVMTLHDAKQQIFLSKGPRAGFHIPFDQHDPMGSEELWGRTETRIPKMYAALGARREVNTPTVEAIVRDVLALHWARSAAMRLAHEHLTEQVSQRSMAELANAPELLRRAMLKSTGLHPFGPGALEWFNRDVHGRVVRENREAWWSERNAHHLAEARRIMDQWPLQFGYAPLGSDLIISDAPVVTRKPGHDGCGPHQGVALGEATEIVMPLSPTVLVGMGPEPKTLALTPESVQRFNEYQIRARVRWLGCRPSGTADRTLRATLPVRRGRPPATPKSADSF
ncbi:DUF4238 domain-containing protein [Cellulosimicrobium funkei]|uniref:DUF4238 domain-containing protein n=1 Tax=Cellulosimicrobium funkei TaxID=264251 RepID=UPI0037DC9E16